MLRRSSTYRTSSFAVIRESLLDSLLSGRRKRVERQRQHRQRSAAVESLEVRALLSGQTVVNGLGDLQNDITESHAHAVFAPGTPLDYVNSVNDYVGEAGGTGPDAFNLASRWSTTATSGSGLTQGDPTILTWSIVPDGTAIPALGGIAAETADPSNLVSYLGGIYGVNTLDTNYTDEPWFTHFESVFDRWSELTGLTYVYEPFDDGVGFTNTTANPGVTGVRGDVRIGGHYIDGPSNVLAYNFYPNHGDMVIDTGDTYFTSTTSNSLRLRNTLAHEAGHGIGLRHVESNNAGFLMEPFISLSFDGPQLDDILAAQRHYGDDLEGNDTSGTAFGLGVVAPGQSQSIGGDANDTFVAFADTSIVTIDGIQDNDIYSFSVTSSATVDITLTQRGPTYNQGPQGGTQSAFDTSNQNDLILELIGSDGITVIGTGVESPVAPVETISFSLAAAGTYYVRVRGTVDAVQAYELDVAAAAVVQPALTVNIAASSISEAAGVGATTATVTRNSDTTNPLTVTLTSGDLSEAIVPLTVTIPAGQTTSAAFAIDAVDDALVDGTQTVLITATALNHLDGVGSLDVTDDDVAALTVTINPAAISENGGTAVGTVTRNTSDLSQPVTVQLTSDDTTEATVPASVIIPAGSSSVNFPITGVDDAIADGTQSVNISATVANSGVVGLDTSFGTNGLAAIPGYRQDLDFTTLDVAIQPDGKIIAAGRHPSIDSSWNVYRLNVDGSLDTTWGNGGIATTTFTSNGSPDDIFPQGIALYPDGQVIVIGRGVGTGDHVVARYDSAGGLNLQLNADTAISGSDIIVDNSGDGGFFAAGGFAGKPSVRRYHYNGTVDISYGVNGLATSAGSGSGYGAEQQADGKIVLVGNSSGDFGVSRFNTDGSNDSSFSGDGFQTVNFGATELAETVRIQPDGKIVIVGSANSRNNWATARLNTDGSLDTSFSGDGKDVLDFFGLSDEARDVAVQQDGRIIVGGGAFVSGQGFNLAFARYNSDGTLDTTFDGDGRLVLGPQPGTFEQIRALANHPDGSVVALGGYVSNFWAMKLDTGTPAFQPGSAGIDILDDETATLTLTIAAAQISEADGVGATTATVSRNSDTTNSLTVTLASSDTSEATVPLTVIIPAGQTTSAAFQVNAVDDVVIDGTQTVTVTASAPGHVGAGDSVDVTDNDVAGFTLTETDGDTIVDESGTQDQFLVQLTVQPATNVIFDVSSSDTGEVTANVSSLTFTPANWNVPQTVTLTGVDDLVTDGDQSTQILVSVNDAASDPAFASVPARAIVATTTDDDQPTGTISGTKFEDVNGNGLRDSGEPALGGVRIYLDLNHNGAFDNTPVEFLTTGFGVPGVEPSVITDANGNYLFTEVPAGDYTVREVVPRGYSQTYPNVAVARMFAIDPNVTNSSRIVELDPATGATLNTFNTPTGVSGATAGLAFDGHTIFLVDSVTDTLYEIQPDTGAVLDTMALATTPRWDGVAVMDGLLYLNDPVSQTVTVVNPATNTIVRSLSAGGNFVPSGGLGELPDASGGQLIAPIGSSSVVALLDPVSGAVNSSFSHAAVNGTNVGATSIDGEIYLGFNDPGGTVLVYTPTGSLVRTFQVGFDVSGLGASNSIDGAHRITVAAGQEVSGLDFGNQRDTGSISGVKFEDLDGDGQRDAGEGPLVGVTIYLDSNDNGVLDTGELSTQTASDGTYQFTNLPTGNYSVREVVAAGFIQTSPAPYDAFYYGVAASTNELVTIDAATGQVTRVGAFGTAIHGIATSWSGEIFALQGTGADSLYSVDPVTGAATLIGPIGGQAVFGLAYDSQSDTLFTIVGDAGASRDLVSINQSTGAVTVIGPGTPQITGTSGIAFDAANNRVIAFDNADDQFWAFDAETGAASLLSVATPALAAFGFTHNGSQFVMSTSGTTLSAVNVIDGTRQTILTLSESIGLNGLDYVPASTGSHRVTVAANAVQENVDFGNQRKQLTLSIVDSAISENGGTTTATVTRNTDTTNPLTVTLVSSDTGEATVMGTVIIPAGETTSPVFTIAGVDDALADGNQIVSITASAADHADGVGAVEVIDDETAALTVTIDPSSISEAGGTAIGTVSRNTDTTEALVVLLASSDETEATVPASVTIPAGQSSATFTITAVDDALFDGTQSVSITATG
ncbi:MAG: matrixin family metalloprotease, partial [Planctomycetaceae bacterium]|nr:matrixin family metalloprotease [Planctomycetaceae bacterium]